MCGKADEAHTPAAQPVRLKEIPPTSRPPTSTARDRPSASGRERPASARRHRPASSSASSARPSSKSTRPSSSRRAPKTAGAERHSSSRGDRPQRPRPRSQFPSIQEYPEDKTIINSVAELVTLIDQHVEYYYPHDGPHLEGTTALDNPRTRHATIRKHIAREIISSIIMTGNSSPDVSLVAHRISEYVEEYSGRTSYEAKRKSHILELCKLGMETKELIDSHPAHWEFGSWDEAGFILLLPTLLRDGEQVVARQIFRIS
ncbi:uncharacterized protein BP5553_02944 [Venustampulla echinocandica]|uniref:Uncharacterized protein n=1 Tax=Venustampulla echinocandica TaxID=2656787 RepID=A0A370TSY7_9HELO|nr:uncharacterized protein BP5553_02944 [Venustampulla echinocandica]RDL38604.1 hypothetical protein BP5553_02944 [Venustampulla echinocandica]